MKENLVVIHGLNQEKVMFWKFFKEFKDEFDLRYFYYSKNETIPKITDRLDKTVGTIKPYHVVTMSLGAIILRNYLARYGARGLRRVVMVGPPNKGAEILRNAVRDPKWRRLLGELAVDFMEHEKAYLPLKPEFEVGIIAGTKPKVLLPPVSMTYIKKFFDPTDSDGKVKIGETKLPFMKDFVTVEECHDLLMQNEKVLNFIKCFLVNGTFNTIT